MPWLFVLLPILAIAFGSGGAVAPTEHSAPVALDAPPTRDEWDYADAVVKALQ